jgi:hypothetical protein
MGSSWRLADALGLTGAETRWAAYDHISGGHTYSAYAPRPRPAHLFLTRPDRGPECCPRPRAHAPLPNDAAAVKRRPVPIALVALAALAALAASAPTRCPRRPPRAIETR